jgi:hypothetical protein
MHGMGLHMVAVPENDGMKEKWEIKTKEMWRQW